MKSTIRIPVQGLIGFIIPWSSRLKKLRLQKNVEQLPMPILNSWTLQLLWNRINTLPVYVLSPPAWHRGPEDHDLNLRCREVLKSLIFIWLIRMGLADRK